MRFVHLSDVHIRNLKFIPEYKIVFEEFYKKLEELKPDYIVLTGDVCHSKTILSPEYVDLAGDFLNKISEYAPLYITLGNHDQSLSNRSRLDAVSPIVKLLNNRNIHLLKYSQEVELDKKFTLNCMSILDQDKWIKPTDKKKINIALYHGMVKNSKTDTGRVMDSGEDISIFDDFDYTMLGDIHLANQVMDKKGKIRYAGDFIQQSFGEEDNKGFLVWDIESKTKFTCEHIVLNNPKPFITIELNKDGSVPKRIKIEPNSRIRLVSYNTLTYDTIKKALDLVQIKFKPESVTFLNKSTNILFSTDESEYEVCHYNLRDINVQNELIKEQLKEYNLDNEIMERIFSLNERYKSSVQNDDDGIRNLRWNLRKLEWYSLFNYGENNTLIFDKLKGIVGIFGKSFSGKSSIIDSLLFIIFNSTSKSIKRNFDIINQNKLNGGGRVEIEGGNKIYVIERDSEKYQRKLKGQTTEETKSTVNFYSINKDTGEEINLNGDSRPDTDKNIRKVFGTLEDFLLTCMSSQFGSMSFIFEGSTKRKEILAKFLDLEVFDRKYRVANEDFLDIKTLLKKLEGRNYDLDIVSFNKEIKMLNKKIEKTKKNIEDLKITRRVIEKEINELENILNTSPPVIDIKSVREQFDKRSKLLSKLESKTKEYDVNINKKKENLSKINEFLTTKFNIEEYKKKKEDIKNKQKEVDQFLGNIRENKLKFENNYNKTELLKEVPCGPEFSHCKFIKDAYLALDNVETTKKELDELAYGLDKLYFEIEQLQPEKIDEHIEKYNKLLEKKNKVSLEISELELEQQKNNNNIFVETREKMLLKETIDEYDRNKKLIDSLGSHLEEKKKKEKELNINKEKIETLENELMSFYKEHGHLERQVVELEEKREELLNYRKDYEAYSLLLSCLHSNGIPTYIIRRNLPIINSEICKTLSNMVKFQIFFTIDDNRLELSIQHPKYSARSIDTASGAERALASIVIRLALMKVTTLSIPNVFILDEPAVQMDSTLVESFGDMLALLKDEFNSILLISHIDSLKDSADMNLEIQKDENGYAYINNEENK